MGRSSQDVQKTDIIFVSYNPVASSQDRVSARSDALAHAARISHRYRTHKSQCNFKSKRWSRTLSTVECQGKAKAKAPNEEGPCPTASAAIGPIQYGNSDPFDSMTISITPEVTSLLSMWRLHVKSNKVPTSQWITEAEVKSDFSLGDEFHGKALLFACSALLSSRFGRRPDLVIKTLEHKQACLQQLAARIGSGRDRESSMIRTLSLVFIAACLFNEMEEAKMHARQMRKLLKDSRSSETYESTEELLIHCRVHYYDSQTALAQMRPCALSQDLMQDWGDYLAPTQEWTLHRPRKLSTVTSPRFNKSLEDLFSRLQTHIDIQCEAIVDLVNTTSGHGLSASLGFAIEMAQDALNAVEVCEQELAKAEDPASKAKLQAELLLATCAVAQLACAEHGPVIDGAHRGNTSMQYLRRKLEDTQSSRPKPGDANINVRLWALYLGSTWECEWDMLRSEDEIWFTPRLQMLVQELRIQSWDELIEIADGFLRVPSSMGTSTVCFLGMRGPKHGQKLYRTMAQSLQDVIDYRI